MHHYSAELQTAKQTLTTSKNSIEFTYSDFPCDLKVNRDKLALINYQWKCKKGKRLTITANPFTEIDQYDGFCLLWWADRKFLPTSGTNQIAGFVEFCPLMSWKKNNP